MGIIQKLEARAVDLTYDMWAPLATVKKTEQVTEVDAGLLWKYKIDLHIGSDFCVQKGAKDEEVRRIRSTAERSIARVLYQDVHPILLLIERAAAEGDRRAVFDACSKLREEIDPR